MQVQAMAGVATNVIKHVKNWPLYFLHRLQLAGDKPIVFNLRNGVNIESRAFKTDRGILNDVWFEEIYEPNNHDIPFDWKNCKNVIDIGGNVGTFSLYAAYNAPNANIYTYEPEPGNAEQIRHNIAHNNLEDRMIVEEKAVGAAPGEITLHVFHHCSGGHSIHKHSADSHPIKVEMIPLKQIFDTHNIEQCDFLKIDCEGAEYDILYNLPDEYFKRIKLIALERHLFSEKKDHNEDALNTFLKKHGFTTKMYHKCMMLAVKN